MIRFVYDVVLGLLFWEIKDVPRIKNEASLQYKGFSSSGTKHHLAAAYKRTKNK